MRARMRVMPARVLTSAAGTGSPGKSIAVPFVGATAATLVIAEAIRLLHNGPAYTDIKVSTAATDARAARTLGNYRNDDLAGLKYCLAQMPELPSA